MAEMTDAQFKQKVIDVLDEVGANIGSAGDIDTITSVEEWNRLANSITLPGIEMEQSEVKRYVAAPLSYFAAYAESASAAIQTAWQAWFGITDDDGVRHSWLEFFEGAQAEWTGPSGLKTDVVAATNAATAATKEWYDSEHPNDGYKKQVTDALATAADDHQQAAGYAAAERTREEQESARQAAETQRNNAETTRQSQETARQSQEATRQSQEATRQSQETARQSQETTRQSQETAREEAEQSRVSEFRSLKTAAETATAAAENVDATLTGTTLTVTDRNGHSNSVDTAAAAKAAKADWDNNYKAQIETAQAGAENVDASLGTQSGTGAVILTVWNRNNVPTQKEVGFRVAKTYATIAAMNAAIGTQDDVEEGRFVMIAGDVQDVDTGKLYVRAASLFSFLVDLSGAQGMKGDTPVMTATQDGTIYADGVMLTEIIKNAVAAFEANEGTPSSPASNTTRWGAYKLAEQSRDSQYTTAESTRGAEFSSAQSARQSAYTTAEADRDSAYLTAEEDRGSAYLTAEANRNTQYQAAETERNGNYTTAEETRNTNFDAAQQSRNTAWTDWFSKATTGVQDIWTNWFNATKNAWTDWFSKATTGVQAIWTAWFSDTDSNGVRKKWNDFWQTVTTAWGDNNSGMVKSVNDAVSAANAATADAERVDATLTGTTITVTDRNGRPYTANLKGETGEPAGFANPTATVADNTPGTPSVAVAASGSDTAKLFSFTFSHIKGEKGDKGDALDYASMTPEEKQDLVDDIKANLVFATVEEGQAAAAELN